MHEHGRGLRIATGRHTGSTYKYMQSSNMNGRKNLARWCKDPPKPPKKGSIYDDAAMLHVAGNLLQAKLAPLPCVIRDASLRLGMFTWDMGEEETTHGSFLFISIIPRFSTPSFISRTGEAGNPVCERVSRYQPKW